MKQEEKDRILESFPGLGKDEKLFKYLCYLAYAGEVPSWLNSYQICVLLKVTKETVKRDYYEILIKGGYISDNKVSPKWIFKVLLQMLDSFPKWAETFNKLSGTRYESTEYLWNIAVFLHRGDIQEALRLKRPNLKNNEIHLDKYLAPIVTIDRYSSASQLLSEKELRSLVSTILRDALLEDNINEPLLNKVDAIIHDSSYAFDELYDQVGAYRYFSFGPEGSMTLFGHNKNSAPFLPHGGDTLWSLACEGIQNLYAGNLSAAREKFALALTLFAPNDHAFEDPILTYFYGLCIYKSTISPESSGISTFKEAWENLKNARQIRWNASFAPINLVFTYLSSNDAATADYVKKEMTQILTKDNNPFFRIMATLVFGYFKIKEEGDFTSRFGSLDWVPSTAILRHELSIYIPVGFDERDSLKEQYGGSPVLAGIKRKEQWEFMLQDIRSNIINSDTQDRRIVYLLDGLCICKILEQKRMSNGHWDAGTAITRSIFTGTGVPSMNDTDHRIANELRGKSYSDNDASIILPLIGSSERVFVGSFNKKTFTPYQEPLSPVQTELIRPYIEFKTRGTRIYLESNIELEDDGKTVKKNKVVSFDEEHYYLISLTDLQRDLLARILPTKEFPISALPQLRLLEDKLQNILEVRSDLALAAAMPKIDGTGTLAVRITPEDGNFKVFLQSCPVPDGELRFVPGEGEEEIFDKEGGITKLVRRNLRGEFEVYNILRKELEEEKLVFEDYQNFTITNPETLLKLLSLTHDNPDKYIVEWPEGQMLKFKGVFKPSDINVQVVSDIDWFRVQGKVSIGGGASLSIKELLKSFREAKESEYIRIGDREYMKMTGTIRHHLRELDSLTVGAKGSDGSLNIPQYRIGALAKVLGTDGGLHATVDQGYTNLLDKMKAAYSMEPELPEGLNATLRPYQKAGFDWMVRLSSWDAGACLADDMGLGKTLQTLSFLLYRAAEGPSLVIAPKSVAPNWKREAEKFTPSLNLTVLNSQRNKQKTISEAGPGDVIVTTYGMLLSQLENLREPLWNVICLDEAHQIKNKNTRSSSAAMSLKAKSRLILTGTPIQNHLGDMWNLFQFINPGLLGPWQEFMDKYINNQDLETQHSKLHELTSPFILRRTKEEVLDDLPEKISYNHLIELSDDEMLIYERCRTDAETLFSKEVQKTDKPKLKISFFEMLTKLRLIANSVSLAFPDWTKGSSKVDALMEILDTITSVPENQVLIFSQFTSFLDIVKEKLQKEGIEYQYLDGQTSLKEREKQVEEFQRGERQIFLISLKAGGLGLNLTAANYVILLDPWWNPAIENQATDRAHRIGQKRAVTIIRMIAAQTIEEKILKLHEKKKELAEKMLEGTAESSSLTMDDILDLVSPYR